MNKILALVLVFVTICANAQPSCPPGGCTGGGGVVGPGARATSPIDMYVYVLGIAAILMIAYFAKKYKTHKI